MPTSDLDRDLTSIQQARELARTAADAQKKIEGFDQGQIDAIVEAMAAAGLAATERLARLAREETGYGNIPDKVKKNNFVLEDVVDAMRGMRTVGILREDREHGVYEIAEPVGVVAGIIPTTNPTSTALFKCLIALKARCGIVLSPHPSAKGCIKASSDVLHEAAVGAGAPEGIIGCMTNVTMEGTRELMNGRDTDLILATGGITLVKAAYSAGKPAYGVGPGNVPAYIERTADVAKAVRDIISGTTFDNGTLCSSEQSIICDREIKDEVVAQVEAQGGRFLSPAEVERLSALLITEKYLVNAKFVGNPAPTIAAAAGIDVPDATRVLVCPLDGVGKEYPLSHEKLSPVLAFYVVQDWEEGCERCTELLRFGGMGHTLAIHSNDHDVIMQFGLRKPAHRVLVNTVAAIGAIGLTTHLFPSMTLGCGSWGKNITSDNIGPQHLINVKRLAYETREYIPDVAAVVSSGASAAASPTNGGGDGRADLSPQIVAGAEGPVSPLTSSGALESQVATFLTKRGLMGQRDRPPPAAGRNAVISVSDSDAATASGPNAPPEPPRGRPAATSASAGGGTATAATSAMPGGRPATAATPTAPPAPPTAPSAPAAVAAFVAEDDVRSAVERGEKIRIGPDTIITPLAQELGEQHGVFARR